MDGIVCVGVGSMNISPLNLFPDMPVNPSALEYFWHQLPYGVPGIFTFLVSIFLFGLGIYAASDKRKDKEKRFYFLNFAIAILGYGVLGLVLALRSVMLDKALLLDWNQRIYFFVMIILPGSAYVVYYITDKRYKSSLWFARFSWASLAFGLFGILMGKAFTGEWIHYSFGNYPVATIYLKQWGIMGGMGFFFFVIPISFRYYRYSPEKFKEKWMVIIAVDLLIFLVITNLPSFVGIPWFPGSNFAFIPMALLTYGVFRSDFLNLNDLLFKKGGAYYMVNVIMILVFSGIILGLASSYSPHNFERINWFPWLLIPSISVLAVFLLGIFIGGTNPTREINQFGSILLYQTGFLLFAIITLSLDMRPIVAHRLEQIWYIFFMLTPPVAFRFALLAFNQKMPKYGVFFDVVSILFSAGAMSPYLFSGYYRYSFGNVSSSGPIVQLSAVAGTILAIIVIVKWIKIPKEKKTLLANTTVIFLILNNLLIFGNIPATMGFSLYTTSNFAILPVGILAYGLIKNRSINMQQHAMQVSSRVSLILLFILPIFSIAFFSAQPDEIALKHRSIHILFISTPLFLLSFLILFLFTRPVAMRLDSVMRDLRKEKTETMRQKEVVEKAHLDVEKLNQLSRQIQSSTELQYILRFIIEHIKSNFPIDSLWLLLSSKEGEYLFTYQTLLSDTAGEIAENLTFIQNLKISLNNDESIISHVCRKKKSFYVKSIPRYEILRPVDKEIIEKINLDSVLYNPLISQNNLVGMIIFTCYREKMDLTRNDIRKLESICSQVAGSLNNAYLLEETKKSQKIAEQAKKVAESARSEIQMLNQLIRKLNENHDLKDIMESVSSYVEKNFGFPNAALYLVNDDQKFIRLHYFNCPGFPGENKNDNPIGKTIPITDFKKGHALAWKEGKTLLIPHVKPRMSRLTKEENEIIQECGYKSVIMIPLILQAKFIGFLDFYHVNPSEVSKKDMIKLSLLGEHLTGIIHNASLLHIIRTQQEESERLRELAQAARTVAEKSRDEIKKLNEFSKQINSSTDLDEIIDSFFRILKDSFSVDSSFIQLVDNEKKNLLTYKYYYPQGVQLAKEDIEFLDNMRIPLSEGQSLQFSVYTKKKSLHFNSLEELDKMHPMDKKILSTLNFSSIFYVPLVNRDEVIGMVSVAQFSKEKQLSKEDRNSIERYIEQISGAVYSSSLLKEVQREREASDALLLNILPEKTALELKKSGKVEPLFYDSVSIMFTDFRGFTKSASEMQPEQLIQELDAVFDQFDNISARHHLEKIKTIGDAYMCAAGIPEVSRTHHIDICLAAMSIRQFMIEIKNMKEMISHDKFWEIRIGIHTGSVIAGVVGNKKFQYDMWGDNVNIASRMESYSEPQRINISEATYNLVKDFFECTPRGTMNVRGKGEMNMYFLERLKPEYSHDPQAGTMPNKVFREYYEGIKSNTEDENFGIKKETGKEQIPS